MPSSQSQAPVADDAGRDRSILALKGLAIFGVVLHHTHNRRLDPVAGEWIGALIQGFSWCVLLFLAISGWLHAMSESRYPRSMVSFTSGRVVRLLVPFVALVLVNAAFWQLIQAAHLMRFGGNIPRGFADKLRASLWPVGTGAVAEQLYYLPLLFLISVAVHAVLRVSGRYGVVLTCGAALIFGLYAYPHSAITGFSAAVGTWGVFAYAVGFLLYLIRDKPQLPWIGLACGTAAALALGLIGLARVMPVVLLALARRLRLGRVVVAAAIGEASGTIFAYHTPFILQPLVIAAARLSGWRAQLAGVIAVAALAIAVTFMLHRWLKNTRLKFLLL